MERKFSEVFYNKLDASSYGSIILNSEKKIVYINRWLCGILGTTADQAYGETFTDFFNLEKNSKLNKAIENAVEKFRASLLSPTFHPHPLPLYRASAKDKLMVQKIVIYNLSVETGEKFTFVDVFDLSDSAEKEKYLKLAKNNLTKVFESIQELLFVIDKELNIIQVNRRALEQLGYSEDEILKKKFDDILENKFVAKSVKGIFGRIESFEPLKDVEVDIISKNEERIPVLFSADLINPDTENPQLVVSMKDISDSKKADAENKIREANMLAVSKLSAIGEMAGQIAHEINNPLQVISYQSRKIAEAVEECDEDCPIKDRIEENNNAIATTIKRMTKIIKGLSMLARDSEGDAQDPTSFGEIIDETVLLCEERFRSSGIEINISNKCKDIIVNCVSIQISQTIINLINNAHDAVVDLEEKWINIETTFDEEKVYLRITDSGSIDKSIQDKIFEPFFTTKNVGKGTGIGLGISKNIIASHHGELYLDPESEKTSFVITLPRYKD